jgi:dCTP deaminase/dUTP pyrophosphatase
MFESGRYVAEHVDPALEAQIQPNGVDLTAAAVFEQTGPGRIGRTDKRVGERRELDPADGTYRLDPGGYVLRYGQRVAIPDDHVGFVYPRSTLLRNSCMLHTAVWDAGYEGRGEGLLEVHAPVEIEVEARVAQFVLARADHESRYDGSYQGENRD